MTKQTTPAVAALNEHVTGLLTVANDAGATADRTAREAATVAHAEDHLDEKDHAKRLQAILADYAPHLTHPTVKTSFSAALAILVAGTPVRVAVAEKTEVFKGGNTTLRLKAMDVLEKGEKPDPEKQAMELTPALAVAQLQSNDMKAVAAATRSTLGMGGNKGAGRKAAAKPNERAPYMDETVAVLKDHALAHSLFQLVGIAAKQQPHLVAEMTAVLKSLGYSVTRKAAK